MIEDVGNLACPALFDLGERAKVVIVSVLAVSATRGDGLEAWYAWLRRQRASHVAAS